MFHVFADPKQEITKSFIHTTSNLQKIEELVAENSPVVQLQPGKWSFGFLTCKKMFPRR